MVQKLTFTDMELDLFQPETPTTFGNEGKEMVVSDNLVNCNGNGYFTCKVLAYLPSREYPVVTPVGQYRYCAEIPVGKILNNKYLDHNSMLIRGKVSSIFALPGTGKTEALCKTAIDAGNQGYSVLYITLETSTASIYKRMANMAKGLLPVVIIQGKVRMTTKDINTLITSAKIRPDVVIIDYISLVDPDAASGETDYRIDYRIRRTYSELVDIARKNEISIVTAEAVSAGL